MKPTFTVVRAVGAEFARRALLPLTIIGVVAAVVLLGTGGWLVTMSAWWWILEFVFICGTVLFIGLVVTAQIIVGTARPKQTKPQKQAVNNFVDKLERVAESLQTPQVVVLFRIVRDIAWPREDSFIASLSRDSRALAPDFQALRKQFE